ncbi:translation initiation factor eIF-2B subunit gamma [Thraustotheca clavata]|uniref:Translation initiation factor eIF2B subunit gamma n=1 Tax=Thraustotheca clavata TaxID=74557 RepID=A0A1V9YU69_9STRA|nr:translation initiation factor eIF-2B subunit gamma [Thraustotheca clavata]
MAEFQAVILAGGSGVRLYPLTEDTPKPLLLVNGKPLIYYQLALLENSGFSDVLLVTAKDMIDQLKTYVLSQYNGKMSVEIVAVEGDATETADALRCVADKIRSDFIVLAGDLITDCVLHNVADLHRINDASVTMLLKQEVQETPAKGVKSKEKPRRDEEMTDCIGMVDAENRVVFVSHSVYENDDLEVPRALLKRRPRINMHTDLYDAHVYIFAHWILDLLAEKKHIASIKADLIPHLVRRQFRGRQALPESVRSRLVSKQHLAQMLSVNSMKDDEDLLKVYAHVLPPNAYCERADTKEAFNAMEREVKSKWRLK